MNRFRAHAANVRAVFAHGTAIRQEQQVRVVFDEVVTLCATTGTEGTVVRISLVGIEVADRTTHKLGN